MNSNGHSDPDVSYLAYLATLPDYGPKNTNPPKPTEPGKNEPFESPSVGRVARYDSSTLYTLCHTCGGNHYCDTGDTIACNECGAVLFLDVNGDLVSPTWQDFIEIDGDGTQIENLNT